MIGKIIGNYKIEQKLGEGGMGAVYKGVDTMLDREVAIKALRPELASQTAIVERFRSEAVTLAKLNHPNVATLFSMFRHGEELYMVLEFVRGETLDTILRRRGALPAEEVVPVFCQILDGINHAHEYGIIHRDIKPANMMLTEKGTLKVLDFGIARLLGSTRMTRAGNIIGTLEYMAPEQVKGQETDARSDIYALGMMLYEMLTGKTPFDTENEFELMKLQTEQMPVAPRQINSQIPESVEAAIMQAIAKNPDERFQTAGEFRDFLLDAGFNDYGKMRRSTTGDRQSLVNFPRPQSQSLSAQLNVEQTADLENAEEQKHRFDAPGSASPSTSEIKETRFEPVYEVSAAAVALTPNPVIKETRLGGLNTSNTATAPTNYDQPPKAFFDQLTWIHYAGASFGAVFLVGLLVITPFFLLSGTNNNQTNKLIENKPVNKQAVAVNSPEPPKPAVISTPETAQGGLSPAISTGGNNTLPPVSQPPVPSSNSNIPSQIVETPTKNVPEKQRDKPEQRTDKPAPRDNTPEPPAQRRETAVKTPKQNVPKSNGKGDAEREKRMERLLTDH